MKMELFGLALTGLSACQAVKRDGLAELSDAVGDASMTDPSATETPFLPFKCVAGDFGFLGTGVAPAGAVAPAELGITSVGKEVNGLPNMLTPVSMLDYGFRLDFCLSANDEPLLKRVVVVEPTARVAAPGVQFLVQGPPRTLVWVIDDAAAVPVLRGGKFTHVALPTSSVTAAGLQAAAFGDPSTLAVTLPDHAGGKMALRTFSTPQGLVTAAHYTTATNALASSYPVFGTVGANDPFARLATCKLTESPVSRNFKIGTASVRAETCTSVALSAGVSVFYRIRTMKVEDPNQALPEALRATRSFGQDVIDQVVHSAQSQHNFCDALVLRVPGATYACYEGSQFPPCVLSTSGDPDPVPWDNLPNAAPENEQDLCLVRYGTGAWEKVNLEYLE